VTPSVNTLAYTTLPPVFRNVKLRTLLRDRCFALFSGSFIRTRMRPFRNSQYLWIPAGCSSSAPATS